jgi:CheY-like chemotaxis protein
MNRRTDVTKRAIVRASELLWGGSMSSSTTISDLNGLSILIVDDEPDSLEIASTILQRAGARVHPFADTYAAFAALEALDPDLIVSDIGMPLEDGYSFMKRVRSSAWLKAHSIPSLAVTAYTTESDRKRAFAAGFVAHLGKPVTAQSLVEAVRALSGTH